MQTADVSIDRLSFEKVFYFPDHLQALVDDKETYPIHMQLGPVNFCNHDCTFCFAARSMFDAQDVSRQRINVERLMEIIDEMVPLGLKSVTLVGSGEPTLHPRIDEIVTGLGERGVDVGLFTNGSCVTEKTAQALARYATFVRFSLTGATREVHDLVHANGDFDRCVENIKKIVDVRSGSFPTLGSQFILASYSAKDLVKGAQLAKSLGLDYYEIKPAYDAPDKPDQMENTLSVEDALALVQEAESYADENFTVYGKGQQLEMVFLDKGKRKYDDCPGHKSTAVLESDLGLYLCVNQKISKFCFGNLADKSFKEVWHGQNRKEILKNLDVHQCMTGCRQDPLNNIVHEIRVGERVIPLNLSKPDPQIHVNFL